jgi:hypothetical protein
MHKFVVYPTRELEDDYSSNLHLIMTIVVAATFVFMIVTFLVYDWFAQSRNSKVVETAAPANGNLASTFPKNVQDEYFEKIALAEEKKQMKPHLTARRRNSSPS